ncbi:hypothetical protein ADILRU_1394 [Leifsonia rubra CMS 76R]|nr:hypothetical protein ADILRU_1394 [Leifsonia rubra CMS 76R]
MHAVIDDLECHGLATDRCRDWARFAVVDALHGVEGMGEQSCSGIERGEGLLVVGRGMANSYRDARFGELGDRRGGSVEFGGHCDLPQSARGSSQKFIDLARRRVAQHFRAVGALECRVEEWALQVTAEYEGVNCCDVSYCRKVLYETRVIAANQRDDRAGGAVGAVHTQGAADRVGTIVESGTISPMTVDIDEAGREVPTCCVGDVGVTARVCSPRLAHPVRGNGVATPRHPAVGNNRIGCDELCGMDDVVVHDYQLRCSLDLR